MDPKCPAALTVGLDGKSDFIRASVVQPEAPKLEAPKLSEVKKLGRPKKVVLAPETFPEDCYNCENFGEGTVKFEGCIKEILDHLNPSRCDDYDDWLKVGFALQHEGRKQGDVDKFKIIFTEWSKRSSHYKEGCIDKVAWRGKTDKEGHTSVTMGTLLHFLKEDVSPEAYNLIRGPINKTGLVWVKKLIYSNVLGVCDYIYNNMSSCFLFVTETKELLCWNENTCLWEEKDYAEAFVRRDVTNHIERSLCDIGGTLPVVTEALKMMSKLSGARHPGDIIRVMLQEKSDKILKVSVDKLNDSGDTFPIGNNKVVVLSSGLIRDRTREDFYTITTNLDWTIGTKDDIHFITWKDWVRNKYLSNLFLAPDGSVDTLAMIGTQEFLGKCLTTDRDNRTGNLFFALGCGSNGKTKFFDTIASIWGPFSSAMSKASLMEEKFKSASGQTEYLAKMKDCRLAITTEFGEDDKIDIDKLNALTGGDSIVARRCNQAEFTFRSKTRIVSKTNSLPRFDGLSEATRTRLLIVEFLAKFGSCISPDDPCSREGFADLSISLDNHFVRLALFEWVLEGAIRYCSTRKISLALVPAVIESTKRLASSVDIIGDFIKDCLIEDPLAKVSMKDIKERFKRYCSDNGVPKVSDTVLGKLIGSKYEKALVHGQRYYRGISIDYAGDSFLPPSL